MNKILIIYFILFTTTFIGCNKTDEKPCTKNHKWNEVTKKCEPKPVEAALLTQEQCISDLTKIWDTQNNKCKDRSQSECNADGTKWENNQCVTATTPAETGTPDTESEELYTITNNSSVTVIVSAINDPSTLPDNDQQIPPHLLAYMGLRNGECVNVTKDQFTTSLKIKRGVSLVDTAACDNFKESSKCNNGVPAHLSINDHPTTDGQRYNWVEIEVVTLETYNEDCPLLERRN